MTVPSSAIRTGAVAIAYVAAYAGAAWWARTFPDSEGAVAWWLPAGLTVALLVRGGPRAVPLVALADTLALVVVDGRSPDAVMLAGSLAVAAGYGIAAAALARLRFDHRLGSVRDVGLLVAAGAGLGPLLAALGGSAALVAGGTIEGSAFAGSAWTWFVGDAIGVVSVAPVALLAAGGSRARGPQRAERAVQAVTVTAAPVAAILLAERPLSYLAACVVPVVWVSLRGGLRAASLAVLATNVAAALAAGRTGLAGAEFNEVQAFMLATGVVGLYLGAVAGEAAGAQAALTRALREEAALRAAATAVASGGDGSPVEVRAAALAAAQEGLGDALGTATAELAASLEQIVGVGERNAAANEALRHDAATDPLLGIANQRAFHRRLREEHARAIRHDRPLAVALLDLDGFKGVNDREGHEAGDAVLRELAGRLDAVLREGALLARLGGDELAVILPEADAMEAYAAAERLRRTIADLPFGGHRLTVSCGFCDLEHARVPADLVRLADVALYFAKRAGGDRVWRYTPEVEAELDAAERADHAQRRDVLAGMRALARAIDAKDHSTSEHSDRVAALAVAIASELGWPPGRLLLLEEAALVHDVGKIGVPDAVLLKPDRLTPVEYEAVKLHAALGAQIAAEVLGAEQVAWIRSHHERWDGTGYPDRLAADAIPPGARVLAVADCWDVMTSARPYSPPMSREDALLECLRCCGTQFDPVVVDALARVLQARAAA